MTDHLAEGRFRGVYSEGEALDSPTHELTPPRDTIEEVVGDLLGAQKRKGVIQFAQIINTATLHPIEPAECTIARLRERRPARDGGASPPRSSTHRKPAGHDTYVTSQPVGYLLLAMAVICLGTVACLLVLP